MPEFSVEMIFTHLPDAEDPGGSSEESVGLFKKCLAELKKRGFEIPAHFANSAALIRFGGKGVSFARPGLALYGYPPGPGLSDPGLRPVLKLCAPVLQVREFSPGETVGYNRTYRVDTACRIAVLGIGYADGLHRACTGGSVRIRGAVCKIVGKISMDLTTVLLPDELDVSRGDTALIYGDDPSGLLALAERAGTIPYELLAGLSSRVKRVWVD